MIDRFAYLTGVTAISWLLGMTDGWAVAWCAIATLALLLMGIVIAWFKGCLVKAELKGAVKEREKNEKQRLAKMLAAMGQKLNTQTTYLENKQKESIQQLRTEIASNQKQRGLWEVTHEQDDLSRHTEAKAMHKDSVRITMELARKLNVPLDVPRPKECPPDSRD